MVLRWEWTLSSLASARLYASSDPLSKLGVFDTLVAEMKASPKEQPKINTKNINVI